MPDSKHIACPSCSATNRLPVDRFRHGPKCGKCGQPIFNGLPVILTDQNFERQVSRSDIPVVVDFLAEWCGPCKTMAPWFEQAADELEPEVRLAKLDTESNQATAARFGIRTIPTMILFKNGREVARKSGATSAADISNWVKSNRG